MAGKEYVAVCQPVDFSPGSAAALGWAARFAELGRLPLVVLHVVHDPGAAPGSYSTAATTDDLRPHDQVAREQLEAFLDRCRQEQPGLAALAAPGLELAVGLPANRILEVAERIGAGHIVMGSRGRTGLSHLLLGSKAERVVQLSPIPVTIVKAGTPAAEGQELP